MTFDDYAASRRQYSDTLPLEDTDLGYAFYADSRADYHQAVADVYRMLRDTTLAALQEVTLG